MTTSLDTLDRRHSVDAAAAAFMLLLTFSWGLNGVLAKLCYAGYSPVFVNVARSVIGGAIVLAWSRHRNIPIFQRDGTLWPGLLAGALFGLEFLGIFAGLQFTSVARNTLLLNTMPFWVLIGAHFLLGERMSLGKVGGLMLAFCGVALIFSDKLSAPGPQALIGDLLSLAGGVLWAATTLVIKRSCLNSTRAEKLLLYQLGMSALIALPLLGVGEAPIHAPDAIANASLAFQALYIVGFTYVLWFWLMRRYPAAGLASFAFMTPIFAVFAGGIILGEPWSPRIFLALALIVCGLVIVNRPR